MNQAELNPLSDQLILSSGRQTVSLLRLYPLYYNTPIRNVLARSTQV